MSHVVIVREMADDLPAEHNLGRVDIEARKFVRGIVDATDPYRGVFSLLHSKVLEFCSPVAPVD